MEITCRVYRPRRARDTPLFRLVEQHLEEFLRVYQERFAKAHGPLRPVVERVLRGFLKCGIVSHGFARLWCEWLQKEVLGPVSHRHVVLTMPRLLRGIFRKRRELLLDLSQSAAEAVAGYLKRQVGADARPGIVVSIATSGDLVQWHPHGHLLVSDGAFSDDGRFHPLASWDGETVMKLFRERLLARLIERHAISEELARKLLAWRHPGFSAHVGDAIPFEDKKAIEDVACYVVRSPLSLQKLVDLDGQKAVLYRSRVNPSLGRNFEAMDPLEWLARMSDHIPDPGRHRTHFYGFYASRVRACRRETDASGLPPEPAPARRRCSPSWARLISNVYQADPLVCKACGGPLKIVAYITDELSITRVLDHLGLSPPPQKPPPTRELVRVPVDDDGRELQAS